MMAWYQIFSYFFTSGIRIFSGLCLVRVLLGPPGERQGGNFQESAENFCKVGLVSAAIAVFVTVLAGSLAPSFFLIGSELVLMMLTVRHLLRTEVRISFFLIFYYEIAVYLWESVLAAGLGVVFRSESFLDGSTFEYMVAAWIVRLLMLGILLRYFWQRKGESGAPAGRPAFHSGQRNENGRVLPIKTAAIVALGGLFGVVFLSMQNRIEISESSLAVWSIYSVMIVGAIPVFSLNRQVKMEKIIAELEMEKAHLAERDYQALRSTYAANAKLFHDFHNHIEVLHHYLTEGSTAEAIAYLEDMRSPIQTITEARWTGDEAVDYLINSKVSFAASRQIQMKANIEFPRHTNIRGVDLTAIFGNLLDNALEAAGSAAGDLRFISLTVRRINDMLVVKVENGCEIVPVLVDGELRTSKGDKDLHGWGLESVRTAAKYYDGTVVTECEDHIFRVVVTLSFEAVGR